MLPLRPSLACSLSFRGLDERVRTTGSAESLIGRPPSRAFGHSSSCGIWASLLMRLNWGVLSCDSGGFGVIGRGISKSSCSRFLSVLGQMEGNGSSSLVL